MPEWSFVTDATAREALRASMAVAGRAQKWSGLTTGEDRVWRAVLLEFARSGQAPDADRVAADTGLDRAVIAPILLALQQRDLVVLGEGGMSVTAAYPFCAWETGHRVHLDGQASVSSLCAIDPSVPGPCSAATQS